MPNVLDAEPMRAYARRVAGEIADSKIALRYERLAFDQLLSSPRNFRPAREAELEYAPDWARAALARGETVSVFAVSRGASRRLRGVARAIECARQVAKSDETAQPGDRAQIRAARHFLAKLGCTDFDTASRKASYFTRLLVSWTEDRNSEPVCEAQSIPATQGRVWRRVTSVSELRAVGREFRNCLAHTTRDAAYGGRMHDGLVQFWVLRESDGSGMIVAMAPAPTARGFSEVRGPRNAPINLDHIDLARLAGAIGILPSPAAHRSVSATPDARDMRRAPSAAAAAG